MNRKSELHKQWQKHWYSMMSKPLPLGEDLPVDEDFTLHFGLWQLPKEKLKDCFTPLPYGDALAKRAYDTKWGNKSTTIEEPLSDKELLELVEEIINRMTQVFTYKQANKDKIIDAHKSESYNSLRALINKHTQESAYEPPSIKGARVIRGNDDQRIESLGMADSLTVELDDELSTLVQDFCGEDAYIAYYFLSETFYRYSSSYEPHHWMMWGLLEHLPIPDPYEPIMELYRRHVQVGEDENGIVVFVNEGED